MIIKIDITSQQEKFLKKVYGDQTLDALVQIWFKEWLEKQVEKMYVPIKTLDEKITELTTK
jgi:hypothetical protein